MIVGKNTQGRTAELRTVDERCVTQFVENDDVVFVDERRNCSERSCVTAAETERRFRSLPFRECGFETNMWRLRSANQSRRARAYTKFRNRFRCWLAQLRIIRQSEIVVRGKVDQPFAVKIDSRSLRAGYFA